MSETESMICPFACCGSEARKKGVNLFECVSCGCEYSIEIDPTDV